LHLVACELSIERVVVFVGVLFEVLHDLQLVDQDVLYVVVVVVGSSIRFRHVDLVLRVVCVDGGQRLLREDRFFLKRGLQDCVQVCLVVFEFFLRSGVCPDSEVSASAEQRVTLELILGESQYFRLEVALVRVLLDFLVDLDLVHVLVRLLFVGDDGRHPSRVAIAVGLVVFVLQSEAAKYLGEVAAWLEVCEVYSGDLPFDGDLASLVGMGNLSFGLRLFRRLCFGLLLELGG
jgi:hypothetical protein